MFEGDVRQYVSQYEESGMRIARLLHVVDHSKRFEKGVKKEAADMVQEELKKTRRVDCYAETMNRLRKAGLTDAKDDAAWVAATSAASKNAQSELELGYHSGAVKASVSEAFTAIADLCYDRGDLQQCVKYYMKLRDAVPHTEQLEVCLQVIPVAVELQSWIVVNQYSTKAEMLARGNNDAMARIKVARALMLLDGKKYESVSLKLLEIPPAALAGVRSLVTPSDIVTYTCLCSLATLNRSQLKSKLIDNPSFHAYQDLCPQLHRVVRDFYNSDYSCLKTLDGLKTSLSMDYFLSPHVNALFHSIWQRAFKQYTSPYLTVDMRKMSEAFHINLESLEKSLAELIVEGQIAARIDSANKVLKARRDNIRQATFQTVLNDGQRFVAEAEDQLRRMCMLQHGFEYMETRT
ncbi:hypothetical protein DIPPA_00154 [Diplonema papillatum]|nr:hypothetical protein DIPPA_00154 [Diplonema papillatum]